MDDTITVDDPHTMPTRHWHLLEDGRVQCDVCPRACRLHEGQRGLCFVRARVGDQIVLTSYGRSSGFCVDPVEKKPLNHFLPGSAVLSFGTAGCNLACKFCQNWDISKSREIDTLADSATPHTLARTAESLGCRSVAFTYNDPVIFWEYAADVADACHEIGIKAIAVTAGYMCPEPRATFYRHLDAANVDLKAFTEDFYHRTCAARLGAHVARGHRDRLDPDLMAGIGHVCGILPEDHRVVVGERDAAATQSLGRVRKGLRARGVCQSVDLPRLGDVPVLAELAGQVAACSAEREDCAAGQEVVERLLLDGVHAEPARATVGRQDDLVVHAGPDKAQPALALVQPTRARAHIALDSAVLQPVPVPRGHGMRVAEGDRVVHRGPPPQSNGTPPGGPP